LTERPAQGGGRGLVVRDLRKRFGRDQVVDGVSLHVHPQRTVGLLGPNGAGKTTTFGMITGLLRPDGGQVFLDGQEITALPVHERARRGLGYLAQAPSVFRGLTVEDNLLAVLELQPLGEGERRRRAAELLREFGLEEVAGRRTDSLSGGERRRTEIARALCAEPSVLILDEPFASIDPRMVAELSELIGALRRRGLGLLLTDHGAQQLLPLCDEVHVLLDGHVVASGTVEQVVADRVVRERYLGKDFRL